ncbi:hypothetical protein D3C87_1506660 [compost metagenome]
MQVHTLLVVRTVHFGRLAVGVFECGIIGFGIFRYIRPEVDRSEAWLELAGFLIMMPATARTIAFGREPTLVTRHDQAFVTFEKGMCFVVFNLFDGFRVVILKGIIAAFAAD